ncbi:unnamed protein product [Toxocara canis]|uniref:DEP domain-containing protein n=1 Tax=Toxocara canis TaxID=6265 RepID=A0A183U4H5_TOXCA|nr:unnamed protein product [Toxocara canis]
MEMLRTEEAPRGAPLLPQPQTSIDYQDGSENSASSDSDGIFLCIPNEYSRLVASMKKANIIKDNRVGPTIYRNSFKGEHFINWIMQQRHLKLKDALEIGQELIERQFGRQMSKENGEIFSPERYYQIHTREESVALNASLIADQQSPITAKELNEMLVTVLEPLYKSILADNRKVCFHFGFLRCEMRLSCNT